MSEEEIREGDIVTLGDSPTRWRAVRDLDGSLRLVNIGTPETRRLPPFLTDLLSKPPFLRWD